MSRHGRLREVALVDHAAQRYARYAVRNIIRKRFAAPFVLVVGCSTGGPPEKATHPTVPDDAATAGASSQITTGATTGSGSGSAVTQGAGSGSAKYGLGPPLDPCKMPPSPDNPTCNPPRPTKPIEGHIISARTVNGSLELDIDRGREQGVTMQWRAQLTDWATGKIVAPLEVLRVDVRTTRVRLQNPKLSPRDHKALLTPP